MTLAERLHAIRDANDEEDLAELLGVDASTIAFDCRGVTVGDETITFDAARLAMAADRPGRAIKVEDL